MSVVELHGQDKWIPGQQLYGRMIPRPELNSEVHNSEIVVQASLLKKVQDRVKQIKETKGMSEHERRELRKLGVLANTPMSFGYEVVPLRNGILDFEEPDEDVDDPTPKMKKDKSVRVTVKLTSDRTEYVGKRELDHVVLESNGNSTYCISDDNSSKGEGLEIVGLGRYLTTAVSTDLWENDELINESRECLRGEYPETTLSPVFSVGVKTQMAFYRPLESKLDHDLKCKEE
jgi:hypothetical protein